METDNNAALPKWFWALAIFALLWNIMGVMSFVGHVFITDEALAAKPEAERALYDSFPLWINVVFAIAVGGGLFGSIGLLLRKSWCQPLFLISLLAVVVQMSYNLFFVDLIGVYGPQAVIMPILVVLVAAGLFWFSGRAISSQWLT